MAVIDVFNSNGEKISQLELSGDIFDIEIKPSILHEVVTMQLALKRAGTASVKGRSDVSGSTKKMFRQKGTGRARRGNAKANLLRGGGVAFGPSLRKYGAKVPKRVRKSALKMALASKWQEKQLVVIDNFDLEKIKTKDFIDIIKNIDVQNALIVTSEKNENLELSSRNVPGIQVLPTIGLNVYDVLRHKNLVLIESSLKGIEGRLLS